MKTIKLLTDQKITFSVGKHEVELSEAMPVEIAEKIAAQYPGLFLEVIEEKKSPDESEG